MDPKLTTDNLLNRHRWDIMAMANDGKLATEIAKQLECSSNLVTRASKKLGISLPKPPPQARYQPDKRRGQRPDGWYRPHWPKIIELREAGRTYQQIGDAFGITRERVRQILHQAGRSDLTGPRHAAAEKPMYLCDECGEEFTPPQNHRFQPFCSPPCREKFRRKIKYKRDLPRAKRIVELRENGRSWLDTAMYTGLAGAPQCQMWLTQFCKDHDCPEMLAKAKGHYNRSGFVPLRHHTRSWRSPDGRES